MLDMRHVVSLEIVRVFQQIQTVIVTQFASHLMIVVMTFMIYAQVKNAIRMPTLST